MRILTIGAPVLLATAFAAGCSDRNVPTQLSEEPAFNQAPVPVEFEVAFSDFNPCTGALDDFLVSVTGTVHFFELETDPVRHHFNNQFRGDVQTAAGFSGFDVLREVDNGTPEPGATDPPEEFSFTFTLNRNLSNESGQRLSGHMKFHITIRNDGTVVRSLVDNVSLRCVGNPNG